MTADERVAEIRLLLFDVDGVLTDGVVIMHADGSEAKGFHIRDGAAMVWAQRAGLTVGLLSARSSGATTHRAAQLAIRLVVQGVPTASSRPTSGSSATPASRHRRRLHGRRSARPAGAGAGRAVRGAGRCRRGGSVASATGSAQPAAAAAPCANSSRWSCARQNRWDDIVREYAPAD